MTPISMVTAMVPSSSSVVAAFLLFGFRKAGTPLEIASTPVSAAQPEEKVAGQQGDHGEPGEGRRSPGRARCRTARCAR